MHHTLWFLYFLINKDFKLCETEHLFLCLTNSIMIFFPGFKASLLQLSTASLFHILAWDRRMPADVQVRLHQEGRSHCWMAQRVALLQYPRIWEKLVKHMISLVKDGWGKGEWYQFLVYRPLTLVGIECVCLLFCLNFLNFIDWEF